MSANSDMLEVLQADVKALLANVPALADAVILADNEGDIEAKVVRNLAPLSGDKRGLAVVVLLPEITDSEPNLPGPPVTVEIEIQTLEAVTINRQASTGTELRSSQAALITLNALHHQVLGSCSLYSDKDPITPVKVKTGYVSHAVKLKVRANGITGPGKPAEIAASIAGDPEEITLTCATSGAAIYYTTDGSYPEPAKGLRYSAAFEAPAAGTLVRAAAYKTGLNPGNCLELDIT